MLETIKEYLVSLGFEVDKNSYDQANKAVESVGEGLTKFASEAILNFGKASMAIAGFATAAAVGTAKFLDGLGNQQIQMEMLSRQLWTTQQQAQSFSLTLKAMGANLQELYLSPTLMGQYRQLNALTQQMQTPSDYGNQIQMVQSISLQFKQMKLEAYYSLQWIGYYFTKYMAGPISSVKNILQSINTAIVKNMPSWTKHVAEVMASFMQAGVYIVHALQGVYSWLQNILSYLPGWSKGVAVALAALGVALSMNPLGAFMIAVGGATLLLDDFETHIHGGQSALGPFWDWLMKVVDAFNQMNGAAGGVSNLQTLFQNLGKTIQDVGTWFQNTVKEMSQDGTFTELGTSVSDLTSSLNNLIKSLGTLFGALTDKKNQSAMKNFGAMMTTMFEGIIKTASAAIGELSGLINLVSDVMAGKWSAALKDVGKVMTGPDVANPASMLQNFVPGLSNSMTNAPYQYMWQNYGPPSKTPTTATVTLNQTNNINGSDPNATANAVQNNTQMFLMKGMRGMVQ